MDSASPKDINSVKVKIFYTIRGSKSTRLTTLKINNDGQHNLYHTPLSLKNCLWSICSSSPDMICRDHDLSIYTANFLESDFSQNGQYDTLIWEGHGLMSWIMNQQEEVEIFGKSESKDHIDVYIELQPTLQLVKDDFIAALRTRSFNQLKISTKTSSHPTCNCFNYADDFNSQNASPPREHTSNPEKGNDTEFDRYLRQRVHTTPLENASPPLPSRLPSLSSVPVFRPEPIFPQSSNNSTYSKVPQLSPPEARRGYQQQPEDDDDKSQRGALILPMPQYMPSGYQYQQQQNTRQNDPRRSAFTIASLSEKDEHNYKRNSNRYLNSTSNSSTSSTSPPSFPSSAMDNSNNEALNSLIPVIYTPSNKKRKKNSAIMPAEATSKLPQSLSPPLTSTAMTTARPGGQIYQKQQQSQQQVNTAVRTYYEVDRDSQGTYILPVEIDSWTVVELGTVIYDRPAYHNQRYIYPANYTVRKWYRSMVDPKSDTQYTCRILENGREPKFEVTADDCPMTYSGPTPTTVWTIIVRRAFAIRNQEYGHNPVGPDFFGLRKNTIAKMIQDLPNASKCSQYVWQTFEPARFNKPGRNRRRADSTLPGSLMGGVNYSLTSSRLLHNTNLTSTQQSYRANNVTSFSNNHSSNSPMSPPHLNPSAAHLRTNNISSSTSPSSKDTSSPRLDDNHRDLKPVRAT